MSNITFGNQSVVPAEDEPHLSGGAMLGYAFGVLACVALGGVMSGLQVGYFSLDPMKLQLLLLNTAAPRQDQLRAKKLIPLLDQHHFLLVTLLVCTAAAMETMPILLDAMVPSYVAVILSVTLVLIVGEIIPQALCTSRPLLIGSFFAPFIKVMMVVTSPISWPMAKFLDWLIGSENSTHFLLKKTELHALVELHGHEQGGHLESQQVSIMKGALKFGDRTVSEIMIPLSKCFMIELHRVLDHVLYYEIFQSGFSRIPVYDKLRPTHDNIVGLMIVKDLLLIDPSDEMSVEQVLSFYPHTIEKVFHDEPLPQLLAVMKSGKSHMAVVHDINNKGPGDPFRENLGMVTLEDILESIIGMNIEDESDLNDDDVEEMLSTGGSGTIRTTAGEKYRRRTMAQSLTPNERVAVAHQLINLTDIFGPGGHLSESAVKQLIAVAQVYDMRVLSSTRFTSPRSLHPHFSSDSLLLSRTNSRDLSPVEELESVDISQGGYSLYRRGEASEFFTLIIDGGARVRAGIDGFPTQVGPWTVLGTQALKGAHAILKRKAQVQTTVLPPFVPDFSAVLTESARVLRISRKAYLSAVRREMGLDEAEIKEALEIKGTKRISTSIEHGLFSPSNSSGSPDRLHFPNTPLPARLSSDNSTFRFDSQPPGSPLLSISEMTTIRTPHPADNRSLAEDGSLHFSQSSRSIDIADDAVDEDAGLLGSRPVSTRQKSKIRISDQVDLYDDDSDIGVERSQGSKKGGYQKI